MTMKGRTTVYIDLDKAERVRNELGIDTSTLTSQALDIVDSAEFSDMAIELRLKLIDDLTTKTTEELTKVQVSITNLTRRLAELQQHRTDILQTYESNKKGVLLSKLTYTLNNMIIGARYDIPTLMGNEEAVKVMEKIKAASPLWQLDTHVVNLKANVSRYR